jgi:hypothetical protein
MHVPLARRCSVVLELLATGASVGNVLFLKMLPDALPLFVPSAESFHIYSGRSSSFNTGRIEHLYQDPHEPKLRF